MSLCRLDAQELKQELGERAKDIIAQGIGLENYHKVNVKCPFHDDKKPSMSWFRAGLMWRCHVSTCGTQIDIYDYYTRFKNMSFGEAVQKVAEILGKSNEQPIKATKTEYVLPNIKTFPLPKEFIDYMSKRKIIEETLDFWKVKQTTWGNQAVYAFQYFNQDNKLIYVTYRGLGKDGIKGGTERNTRPILWGMWHIDKDKPLVITEGQPDAMAVWQAGYKNVVSVPNGANNFKWVENCWDWLQDIPEFIVFADNDEPGLKMANEIKRKLNNVKIIHSEKHKDANEVLFYQGPEEIVKMINDAIQETPPGIIDLANKEYVSNIGSQAETIETGFYEYDAFVEDWKMQELTIIFGRNGEGKTTFISQIIAHCLEKNTKVLLYSGEMSDQKIQDWLYRQLIGNKKEHFRTVITKYKDKVEPKPEVIKKIKQWHKGKLYLFDRSEKEIIHNIDKFFNVMELAAKKFGVKLFVIDNLMAVLEENADSLFSDQANFVQSCKEFAINNNAHVVLLAHPNKEKKEIKNTDVGNLEKTDISGSGNIGNKADNIIAVERNWGNEGDFDAIITSLKDRETGQRKTMLFYFSKNTLRFYNQVTPENVSYSWDDNPKVEKQEQISSWFTDAQKQREVLNV